MKLDPRKMSYFPANRAVDAELEILELAFPFFIFFSIIEWLVTRELADAFYLESVLYYSNILRTI